MSNIALVAIIIILLLAAAYFYLQPFSSGGEGTKTLDSTGPTRWCGTIDGNVRVGGMSISGAGTWEGVVEVDKIRGTWTASSQGISGSGTWTGNIC